MCVKQVPDTANVEVDPVTGVLKRDGTQSKLNPYDLYAMESALGMKEQQGGTVDVITMGPGQAREALKECMCMGADRAGLISDRKFAGADVVATSYTLSQGIRRMGEYDLILCGKQTTDGDTAQVGPAMAEHMHIPHAAWVSEIVEVDENSVCVKQKLGDVTQVSRISYPCLITVDKDICVPRLPSYRLKKKTEGRQIRVLGFGDLPDQDLSRYGLVGSPTTVERMFAPLGVNRQVYLEGDAGQKAASLFEILTEKKII